MTTDEKTAAGLQKFYLVSELADILRQSSSQIYSLIDTGKLACHRFTTCKQGGIRVSHEQLQEYIRGTETPYGTAGGETCNS